MYELSHRDACWDHRGLQHLGVSPPVGEQSVLEVQCFTVLGTVVIAGWGNPGWLGAELSPALVPLVSLPAGPELMRRLEEFPAGDCPAEHREEGIPISGAPRLGSAGNPCLCMLVVAAAWQACLNYVSAKSRSAIVDAVGRESVVLPRDGMRPAMADPAREDLAVALRLSPGAAATRMRQSRQLKAHPELADLLEQGMLPDSATVRMAESFDLLDADDATHCAVTLAARVRARRERGLRPWSGGDAAQCGRRIAAGRPSRSRARKRAVAGRQVSRWSNEDGTATFSAILEDATAERMYRRLTAMAQALGDDDPRGMDARRADLLADLVLGRCASAPTGVEVNVVIDAASLIGLSNGVADVPGLGPIPADLARELAADARWRAWVTDASGAVVATSSTTYRPTADVARVVRAREPHCRLPGCRRPAAGCDLDHALPWPAGTTSVRNLGPLCRRHHNLKTHAGWQLDASVSGELRWTAPSGVTIVDDAMPDEAA